MRSHCWTSSSRTLTSQHQARMCILHLDKHYKCWSISHFFALRLDRGYRTSRWIFCFRHFAHSPAQAVNSYSLRLLLISSRSLVWNCSLVPLDGPSWLARNSQFHLGACHSLWADPLSAILYNQALYDLSQAWTRMPPHLCDVARFLPIWWPFLFPHVSLSLSDRAVRHNWLKMPVVLAAFWQLILSTYSSQQLRVRRRHAVQRID